MIKRASLLFPKTEKRIVWYGIYGGHYECIVFFKDKPKKSKYVYHLIDVIKGRYYDLGDNNDLIIGCMGLGCFEEIYPNANVGHATNIEITAVYKMELEGLFDEYSLLKSFNFHADGY